MARHAAAEATEEAGLMPTPVIELQRRLTIVGAIRAGGEKGDRRPGKKLEEWRITSPRRKLVEQAAKLYGGDVRRWDAPTGEEWQVYTEAKELPALLMPGYSLRQSYELWEGAAKRLRYCDGIDEELSGGPCICNATGEDKCDLYTRLVVALPELDTVLGWKLITKGVNAAHELRGFTSVVEMKAGDQNFVPVRLRLDQRRGVLGEQLVRYVVPVLDLDDSYLRSLGAADGRELPETTGYTPTARRELSVEQALASVAQPQPPGRGRRAAEMGPLVDVGDMGSPAVPEDPEPDPGGSPVPAGPLPQVGGPGTAATPDTETELAEARAVRDRLNTLFAKLRREGHVNTMQMYVVVAERLRQVTTEELIEEVGGLDVVDGETLHWSPLREALTRSEAEQLAGWLSIKADRVAEQQGAPTRPVGPTRDDPGEFPEGY